MTTAQRLTLRAGALHVEVLPAVGGSIARFDHLGPAGRQPLLRGTDEDYADVLQAASFPLVPYVNRIRGGSFLCGGRQVRLSNNLPGDASPLHGQGWRAPWTVRSAEADRLALDFVHEAGEWPWRYEARQRLTLSPGGLLLELGCRNLSSGPMPCGLGQHPYYPCDAATRLDTQVAHVWTVDADVLPLERLPTTGRYGLRQRTICAQGLDNGYDGWGGTARIDWPGRPVALEFSSPDAGYFQVYSPAAGGFFAAEPVQHANAALNAPEADWAAQGLVMLAPGESRWLHTHFAVLPAA